MTSDLQSATILSGQDYVYAYYTTDNIPFYIGKGTFHRCYDHLNNAVKGKFDDYNTIKSGILKRLVENDTLPIIKIITIASHNYCMELEKSLIDHYGRICDKSGVLANIAEGGEGGSDVGRLGALAIQKKYPKKHFIKILKKARESLYKKHGADAYIKMGQKAMRTLRKKHGEDGFKSELKRRSDLGNNFNSNEKKALTRIKNHGSIKASYEATQKKRLATIEKRGGWSVKCYDLNTGKIKIVKKCEFDLYPNLVGMASKQIPKN